MSETKETSPPEFDAYNDVLFQDREVVMCETEIQPKPEEHYKPLQNLPEEKLKELGKDLWANNIFTSLHIRERDIHMASSIFMPLIFLERTPECRADMDNWGMFFEYTDKAGPRSINGYPIFMSMRILTKTDTDKVQKYYEDVKEAMDNV